MSDNHDQFRFTEDGELEEPDDDEGDEVQTNDFGEPMEWYECKSGIRRDLVSSLLQKAVRRSDEEVAAWASWEMQRSGHGANLWSRLALFAVEELRAGADAILIMDRYHERLDDESSTSWRAKLLAIHAALTAARADSTREATIWASDGSYSYFEYEFADTRDQAYKREANLYHHYGDQLDNDQHPKRPNQRVKCPACGIHG